MVGRNETLLHASQSSNVDDAETDILHLEYTFKENTLTNTLWSNMQLDDIDNDNDTDSENNDFELQSVFLINIIKKK